MSRSDHTRTRHTWAVGLVVAAVLTTGAARPGTAAPTQTTPAQQPNQPQLELVAQEFAIDAGGTIVLSYRMRGLAGDQLELTPPEPVVPPEPAPPEVGPDGTIIEPDPAVVVPEVEPSDPLQLTIEVTNYPPLTNISAVRNVVGSDVDPDAFRGAIDGVALGDLRDRATLNDDGTVEFTLEIATDVVASVEDRLKFEAPGLYPLRIQLLVGDPDTDNVLATSGTIVQRLPGPDDPVTSTAGDGPGELAPPINLSVVTVIPSAGPRATPAATSLAEEALDDALVLAAGLPAPLTLEVPPTLIAQRAETPAGQQALAEALDGDELVALPLVPLDVASAVAVGRGDTFARLLSDGQDLLTEAVPTTPSQRDVWIAAEALSAGGAQQLRDLGVRFVVMSSELYDDTVSSTASDVGLFVEATLPDSGTMPLLVVSDLSDELTSAAADEVLATETATEWAVESTTRLLLAQRQADLRAGVRAPERSLILSTPDLLAPDGRLLGALAALAETTPSIEFVAASELIGVTDIALDDGQRVSVSLPDVAGPSLADRVELIGATSLDVASAASMLPDDDPRLAAWADELEALISTGYTDADVEAATSAITAEANALRDAVLLPDPFTFTLTGRQGTIEIRLGNTSSETLSVVVALDSTKVEFPEGDQQVTLRPNSETSVIVPVEARSNGTSSITLVVTTPAGETIGEPVALRSRVTGFTGLGQVLTAGLVLVLLTWWFTHWRSKRRTALVDNGRDRHPTSREVQSDAL